jgi:hypothetical protein
MKHKKKITIITTFIILLTTLIVYPTTIANPDPRTVRGYVYVDGVITTPDSITLILPDQQITATIPGDPEGYYIIDFDEDNGETGTFNVEIYGETYTAEETITIENGVYIYKINLTVTIPPPPPNTPPNKPINPSPSNNSENICLNPVLSVYVVDLDDDNMNISFYNASSDNLIGTIYNAPNASTASIMWPDLKSNKTYNWYAIANDSEDETRSDTYNFKTETINLPPNVKIIKPCKGVYINNRKTLIPRILRSTLIIGDITLIANATDEDQGIEKVEFYINFRLIGNDTTEPYTCNWTRNHRPRLLRHQYIITVKAYDKLGETSVDHKIVRKFL